MDRRRVALLLGLGCALGAVRLRVDPAPWRLPEDHPTRQRSEVLARATAADDILLAVVSSPRSLLDREGVATLDALCEALRASPAFETVQCPTRAPLVASRDGALVAETPLFPAPETQDDWDRARARVLADPFIAGQLLAEDGSLAIFPIWVRGAGPGGLSRRAEVALRDPEYRDSQAGASLRAAIDEARLAVAMGDAEGPPDRAADEAIRTLQPRPERVDGWIEAESAAAADPGAAGIAAAKAAADGVARPAGVQFELMGARVMRDALSRAWPRGVAAVLLFAALFAGFASGPTAALATVLTAAGAAGAVALAGIPVGPPQSLALCAAACGVAAAPSRPVRAAVPAIVVAASGFGALSSAAGVAGLLAAVAAAVGAAATPVPTRVSSMRPAGWAALVALALPALARPVGSDPSALLLPVSAEGRAARRLAAATGLGAPLHLVGGSALDPVAVQALDEAEVALRVDPRVRGVAGWPDFLRVLRSALDPGAGLPEDRGGIEQLVVLFARPADTRAIVAADRSAQIAIVRTGRGVAGLGRFAAARAEGAGPAGTTAEVLAWGWLAARAALIVGLVLAVVAGGPAGALVWVAGLGLGALVGPLSAEVVVGAAVAGVAGPGPRRLRALVLALLVGLPAAGVAGATPLFAMLLSIGAALPLLLAQKR